MIDKNIWTVEHLINHIKYDLTNDYQLTNVTVCGEIGNFTNHYSGHWYFSIKDSNAFINCAMFKSANSRLNFIPKISQQVIVRGSVNVFEKTGQLQLIVVDMQPYGIGKFYLQFEQTKKKLEPLGYFSEEHKKKIPPYPLRIAVISGANTAALQDIKITVSKRWPIAQIVEFNALVQGDGAVKDIIKALKKADASNCDVMILARGGGSVDDLWCFNDEELAKTIYELNTPIVTGIGHQTDTTIADLVSDERCATPTAAATRVTPLLSDVVDNLNNYKKMLNKTINDKLNNKHQLLDIYIKSLKLFENRAENYIVRIKNQKNILKQNLNDLLNNYQIYYLNNFHQLKSNLLKQKQRIDLYLKDNIQIKNILYNRTKDIYKESKNELLKEILLLENTNPLNILKKGFSLTYNTDNKIIKSVNDIEKNEKIKIKYFDGEISAIVSGRNKYGKENDI